MTFYQIGWFSSIFLLHGLVIFKVTKNFEIILYLVPLPLSICTYHVNSCSFARKIASLDVIDSTFSLAYISNWNASDVIFVKTTNEYLFHCKDANQICTGVTFDFLESKIRTEIPTLVERFFSRKKSRFDLFLENEYSKVFFTTSTPFSTPFSTQFYQKGSEVDSMTCLSVVLFIG